MERAPTSQPEERNDFTAWEAEMAETSHSPEAQDTTNEQGPSRMATLLRNATEHVAGFLDNRAETSGDRKEARAESRERILAIGKNALTSSKEIAFTGVALSFIATEAAVQGVKNTRTKLVAFGVSARKNFEQRQQQRREAAVSSSVEAASEPELAPIELDLGERYDEKHAEALEMNAKIDAQKEAFESYEDNIDMSEFYARHREYMERKEAAAARKEARHERWKQRGEHGANLMRRARTFSRLIGRGAKNVLRRSGSAIKAGASGMRQGWQQSR